jgi:hypothetical protein
MRLLATGDVRLKTEIAQEEEIELAAADRHCRARLRDDGLRIVLLEGAGGLAASH